MEFHTSRHALRQRSNGILCPLVAMTEAGALYAWVRREVCPIHTKPRLLSPQMRTLKSPLERWQRACLLVWNSIPCALTYINVAGRGAWEDTIGDGA